MKRYVAGFAVCPDEGKVALIRKARPAWQRGLLNGIGGHIEGDETPLEAMRREFLEEACFHVDDWREFALLSGLGWEVHFFVSMVSIGILYSLCGKADEPIEIENLADLGQLEVIPNLRWLIPLALDKDGVSGHLWDHG